MIKEKNKNGFTLIELLVVIAIIGLLATVIMASLSVARRKGREAKRAADFTQITQALNLYLLDNDDYPIGGYSTCGGSWTAGFETALSPYLPQVPIDPLNNSDPCATNHYYAFWNPLTWNLSATCPIGTTVLYSYPLEGQSFRDDCNVGFNSIIFNK